MTQSKDMATRKKPETFEDRLKSLLTFWATSLLLMPCTGASLGLAVHLYRILA